jgi:oligopeptide transport system substrate-binding protein
MMSDIAQIKNAAEIIAGEKDKSELGVTAVDDKTLKVELNVPVSYFLSLMYFPTFYPVNEEFFNSVGIETFGTSPETVLSNGAFIMDEYQPATTAFHLKKNDDYWDAARVQLPGLSYQVIQDSQQALMSYQAGDLDATLINGDQVDQVAGDEAFHAIGAGYLWYVSPNQNGQSANKALKNLKIRQALTMAMDREAITNDVLKDGSAPTYTAVPKDFAAGPDGSDFSEDQTMFSDVCSFDADKAKELWAEGLKEEGIDSLSLTMIVDDDDAPKKVSQVLKEQWETTLPGFTMELKTEPKKKRLEDMENDNYEIALTRWGPDYADPMTYLGMWITDNLNNYGFWTNAEYDAIIDDCTTGEASTKPEERWQKLYDAEKIVMDEAVIFPIYTQCNAEMISPAVTGIEFHPVALNRVYKNAVKK